MYTRSRKKDSLTEMSPSTIMDHVAKEKLTIDWEGVKFHARDTKLNCQRGEEGS